MKRITLGIVVTALAVAPAVADPTAEDLQTARVLFEAHQALGNLCARPHGCPIEGRGVVPLADAFEAAEIPGGHVTADAWQNPVLAWCDGQEWAVISTGADGVLAPAAAALPMLGDHGDDLVFLDEQRIYLPPTLAHEQEVGRQKRTMADMRSIATVFETYRIDNDGLPGGATSGFVPVEAIRDAVQPIYIRTLPLLDAWGNPFLIWSDGENYRVVSGGSDGLVSADWSTANGAGPTAEFEADIVFGDGEFRQWPEGPQF